MVVSVVGSSRQAGQAPVGAGVAVADGHQKVVDAMASALMRVCRMYWAMACMVD